MTTDWDKVSKKASAWDSVSAPIPESPEVLRAREAKKEIEEERKRAQEIARAEQQKLQEEAEKKRAEDALKYKEAEKKRLEEQRLLKEEAAQKVEAERKEIRSDVRSETYHENFLKKQFELRSKRLLKSVLPVCALVLALAGTGTALTLMYRAVTAKPDECTEQNVGEKLKPTPTPIANKQGEWGWDKYCDLNSGDCSSANTMKSLKP